MSKQTEQTSDLATLWRMIRQAKPYWPKVITILILASLSAPLALLAPVPLMITVDSVIGEKNPPAFLASIFPADFIASGATMLLIAAIMVVVIAVLSQVQSASLNLLRAYTGEKLTLGFQSELLNHSQRLSLAYHDKKGTSEATYRVQYDASAYQRVIIFLIPSFITSVITLVGMFSVTANLDWMLALVALTVSPVLLMLTHAYKGRLRSQWRDVKEIETRAFSVVQEALGALRIVKAFGQEGRENDRFFAHSHRGVRARIRVAYLEISFTFLTAVTIAIGTALVMYLGVTHVQAEILTLGELLLVMSYLAQLYQPLQAIGQQITRVQGGLASMERSYALLDTLPDVEEKPNALPLIRAVGAIDFDNVSFSYDGSTPVLRDISFSIPANSTVGIIGKTGAGKSTLINLILRLYDPQYGAIMLDGIDAKNYKLKDFRDQFAIVLQDTILFSTSIAENIAYSRPEARMDEIVAAAKSANVDEFISRLPDGYETQVGERGMLLSGGQRQRIAIARAFLKDAPILILDEPTSSVDMKTEASIIDAMERLMSDRTTLMIAHRVSTLSGCDFILELELGQLRDVRSKVLSVRNG